MQIEENTNPDELQPVQEAGEEDRTLDTSVDGEGTQGAKDPLDLIDDAETLRAEAKKYRGISSRRAKPETEVVVEPVVQPVAQVAAPGEYLSRKEFERSNQKTAIKTATTILDTDDEETQAMKKDIDEHFDSIKVHYTGRRGKVSPEDILEDLFDAHAIWKRRNGGKPADPQGDAARNLGTTPVVRPTGGSRTTAAPKTEDDPRFRTAAQPKEWYGKKNG